MPTIAQGSDEMESKIDWSKAPEDAEYWCEMQFFKTVNGEWKVWCPGLGSWVNPAYKAPDNFSWWGNAVARPTTPSWSGEGLPPVGVVCEVFNRELSNPEWEKCTILFAGKNRFLYDSESCAERCGYIENLEFRPVRTSEQIAEDERERFAQELVAAMGKGGGPNALYQARRMYDLGYRKP